MGEQHMIGTAFTVRRAGPDVARALVPALAGVLRDCVEGGASVSFMSPLTETKAEAFWHGVADDVGAEGRALLIAENADGVVGTVQVLLAQPENQPHRADIAKMLVHRRGRRQGIGAALMRAAQQVAREEGKTLLVLDTATGSDAERLYQRLGWRQVGTIPGYALWPDGRPCATTYYFKELATEAETV